MTFAIVMAAGKGTRMKSNHAKTMHHLLDRPIIEHIYDTLEEISVDKKVFVVGFGGDDIKAHFGNKVEYSIQEPQLGTAHAAMQATQLKGLSGKTLIINGDCPLISGDTYRKMLEAAKQYDLVLLTTILEDAKSYGRIIRDENNEVQAIVEFKDCDEKQAQVKEINAGIYCVDNELLWKYFPEITNNNNQHEYYITDLVKIFKAHNHKVGAIVGDKDELQGINSRIELAQAQKWYQNKINTKWMSEGVTIVDPERTLIGPKVQIGHDTVIYPNCRIEGNSIIGKDDIIEENTVVVNSKIGDNNKIIACYITDSEIGNNNEIGPNTHLRGNTVICDNTRIGNYVEMKNVKFGSGSKCAHLTYLGDATVGENCNFGCGVVTVNYDGKNKFHCEIGNHCFIGSNVNLIAPVTIHDEAVLAAGTTITDDVASGDMAIGRVRQEIKPGRGYKYLHK